MAEDNMLSGDAALEELFDTALADDIGKETFADTDTLKEAQKATVVTPAADKPAAPATPVADKPKEAITPAAAPVVPAANKEPLPPERDYTGFEPNVVELLKRSSNETFAWVKQQVEDRKAKEAAYEKQLADFQKARLEESRNVYSDPYGYARNPNFVKAATTADKAGREYRYWQQALVAIEGGQKFPAPVWKGEQLVAEGSYEATAENKAYVLEKLQDIKLTSMQAAQEAKAIQTDWEAKTQNFQQYIQQQEDKYFPIYKGKEKENAHIKAITEDLEAAGQGNNPLKGIFAKLYAFSQGQAAELQRVTAEYEKLKSLKEASATIVPSTNQIASGKPAAATSEVYSDDEFEALGYGSRF